MQIDIALALVFDTPFNIGTGALAEQWTDRPTVKDALLRPLIPGSSLKGRLRHTCEALLRTLQQDEHAACRSPSPDTTCPLDPYRLGDYCPVCRLFGAPRRPAPLVFSDLRQPARSVTAPVLWRAGVSIRRNRRVAEAQRLYDQETVGAGASLEYRGTIQGYLTDDDADALLALLWGGLRALDTVGAGRTGGLGRCRINASIKRNGQPADAPRLEEGLRRWLA